MSSAETGSPWSPKVHVTSVVVAVQEVDSTPLTVATTESAALSKLVPVNTSSLELETEIAVTEGDEAVLAS